MQNYEFNAGDLKCVRKNNNCNLLEFLEDIKIPFIVLRKQHKAYDVHLRRISDFLLPTTKKTKVKHFQSRDILEIATCSKFIGKLGSGIILTTH